MQQVLVKSEVSSGSLGDFTSQAAAIDAIAMYIMASVPAHLPVALFKHDNAIFVYHVKTKMKRGGIRHVTFVKIMEFRMETK